MPRTFVDPSADTNVETALVQQAWPEMDAGKSAGFSLLNEFLLNEIKSRDDALKQIMSIDALLLGAYVAVIMNNMEDIINLPGIGDLIREPAFNYLNGFLFMLAVLTPIMLWSTSIILAVYSLRIETDIDDLLDSSKATQFLKRLNKNKYHGFLYCCGITVISAFYIFFMIEQYIGLQVVN